jgi:hypothetical protein
MSTFCHSSSALFLEALVVSIETVQEFPSYCDSIIMCISFCAVVTFSESIEQFIRNETPQQEWASSRRGDPQGISHK